MNRKLSVIVAAIALMGLPGLVFAQDVVVKTDKTSYRPGEHIVITVRNDRAESIFSIAQSATPEFSLLLARKNGISGWENLALHCGWPECDIDTDGPGEIKAGQEASFEWKPQFYQRKEDVALGEGVYRLGIVWQVRGGADTTKWAWKQTKANEFTISK